MDWFADVLTQGVSASVIAVRLLLATLLGAVLGWEREARDKPAGLRTHMLVSIGSATFTLLGFETAAELSEHAGESGHEGVDPTRIIQGIVGGLGFLGAGSIIKARGSEDVSGLTTAASVWYTGALGVACGMGAYVLALISAVLGMLVLSVLGRASKSDAEVSKSRAAASDTPSSHSKASGTASIGPSSSGTEAEHAAELPIE
jgi:putative Mg2+ transporter-C (MgtC) family protein